MSRMLASRLLTSARLQADGQLAERDHDRKLDADHAVGGLANLFDVLRLLEELLEEERDLAPRQVGSQTEMRTSCTEGHVLIGLAADVESEWILEAGLVAVARRIPKGDAVPLADRHAGKLVCRLLLEK